MATARPLSKVTPTGVIAFFANSGTPPGWLKCNGSFISQSTYSDLYAVIGGTYGLGSGSFKIPDLRGVFMRNWSDGAGVDTGRTVNSYQDMDWKGFYQMNVGQNTFSYNHGEQYMGKNTSSYQGLLFGGWWSAPAASIGYKWDTSEIRPSNIAFTACIKY